MSALIDVLPRWHYAGVLVLCLALTAPLEVVLGARVYRRPVRILGALTASLPYLAWDVWATSEGHWWFSARHTLGWSVGNLPLEEIAFFVVIPLCALLTFEAVGRLMDLSRP